MSEIKLVRIYEHEQPQGYRILVDRMWPRGISKVKAALDEWDKEIGPTNELRKWFNHEDEKFPEFQAKYETELDHNHFTPEFIQTVKSHLEKEDVLFLYGAKNKEHNQAVVLKKYVEQKL
ncbi:MULTISPECIES: DUF488 domain-containing protein [Lactobacillus]|uniref:DUF488 family protein n=1 Tax=Lactobacillus xujianguonis TaxID=2495899 RepID=A0A437SVX5_9LACO|nr:MULTISPECIES: DUF488 family protein [Lactobacillus]RVU71069.1 DUF488 family protein [Lactobacillus xujianguonis]RVU76775.1 DUF488 family protein [Lactobacillus xujianguonis]